MLLAMQQWKIACMPPCPCVAVVVLLSCCFASLTSLRMLSLKCDYQRNEDYEEREEEYAKVRSTSPLLMDPYLSTLPALSRLTRLELQGG